MAIFQAPPPQAPSGASAVTPPTPHLIPATGDQPPLRQVASVLAIVAVLASWPVDLEPRLHAQNAQQTKIAPLTLTYGQQPPKTSFLSTAECTAIQSWPLESRLAAPNQSRVGIASLIPPILTWVSSTPFPWTNVLAWQPLPIAVPRPVSIAPLTLTYGQQPPISAALTVPEFATILANQPAPYALPTLQKLAQPFVLLVYQPAPSFPYALIVANQIPPNGVPVPVKIAPLTLVYGNQPQRQSPLSRASLAIVKAWEPPFSLPQVLVDNRTFASFADVGYTVRVTGLDVYQAIGDGLGVFQAITTGLDQSASATTGLDGTVSGTDGLDDVR